MFRHCYANVCVYYGHSLSLNILRSCVPSVFSYAFHPVVLLLRPCMLPLAYLWFGLFAADRKKVDKWTASLITLTHKRTTCMHNEKESCWLTRVTGMWRSLARFMFSSFSKGRNVFILKGFGTKDTRSYAPRSLKNSALIPWPLNIMAHLFTEILRTINPATQLVIPADPNAQQHYCRHLKSCKYVLFYSLRHVT